MFKRRPLQLQYLTVVTYGRTGSTALQAALNTLPGVLIRGENYSALRGIEQYVQAIAETADRHRAGKPGNPWYGSAGLHPREVLADQRRHVIEHLLRPDKDTRIVGFKEVRYEPGHFANYELMMSYLLFLNALLPGIAYVINVREPQAAARSGWWPKHDDPIAALTKSRDWLLQAAHDLNQVLGAERAFVLNYEEWEGEPGVLIDAFDRMRLPANDSGVRQALAHRLDHGPHGEL